MSKQIHKETEENRKTQVRFRAGSDLVEEFDEWVEGSDYDSRSEALRAAMRHRADTPSSTPTVLQPPNDETLREGYIVLCQLASEGGYIPNEVALNELCKTTQKSKETVKRQIIKPLTRMGYLLSKSNVYGDQAWKLNGVES